MLNFLTSFFNKEANARNTCGDYNNPNNVIQECTGCDSECMYGCGDVNEQGSLEGGGCSDCNDSCVLECVGNCISWSSFFGTK